MAYAQYGNIAAADYNALVGGDPVTANGYINTVWATGGTTAGYGQPALANVTVGTQVYAADWANLVNKTANCASHQGTSITSVTAPAAGDTITYLSAIPTNLGTIYAPRLNAATQGLTTSNAAIIGTTWSSIATFTHTVTFANGDAARYFFNAGGQLKVTCAHANAATGINLLMNNLASNIGTVVLSAPTTGSITISSVSYNGVTKIGTAGNAPTILPNNGYFALNTSNANIFTQTAATGPAGYLSTFIRIIAKSNGTVGTNGDAGNVITIYTVWDEIPNGLTVGTGSTTTVTVQAPETTYIANTWGTITVTGSGTAT